MQNFARACLTATRTPSLPSHFRTAILLVAMALACAYPAVAGDEPFSISLTPDRDNTLYELGNGETSNDAGDHLFAGVVFLTFPERLRRAVLYFDIAANVPPAATITGARLEMTVTKTRDATMRPFDLHRLQRAFGASGMSDAIGQEGMGAPASPLDATWLHSMYDTELWTSPGGDFDAVASASEMAGPDGSVVTWSSATLLSDVQAWRDDPSQNHGWLLRGPEDTQESRTARRFASGENPEVAERPKLIIDFTLPSDTCLPGGVGGAATPNDVLFVNGQVGDAQRMITVQTGDPLAITMASPPSRTGQSSRFVLYAWRAVPSASPLQILPFQVGVLCLPPPLSLDVPKPRVVWNNLGAPGRLGQATKPSTPAPSTVLNLNNGLGSPITATLQGIIQDDDSDSPRGLSTTNAIVLDVL